MSSNLKYEMDAYWNDILKNNFSLKGVGWSDWPESYNVILYKKYLKGFIELIKDLELNYKFNIAENKNMLEIGPGVGFYTNYFYSRGIENYTGIDISSPAVDNLNKKFTQYSFLKRDISDNELNISEFENKFDLICIIDVLLHITDESKHRQAIKNISAMLKPGGYLISGDAVTVRNKINTSKDKISPHNRIIHITDLNKIFNDYDLKPVKIYQRCNFLLNENFDFNHSVTKKISKAFFSLISGSLHLFKKSENYGKLIGYPLSLLDSAITPFQKEGNNCKFLLYKKLDERTD